MAHRAGGAVNTTAVTTPRKFAPFAGVTHLLSGLGLLARTRRLWPLVAFPFGVGLLVLMPGIWLAGSIQDGLRGLLPAFAEGPAVVDSGVMATVGHGALAAMRVLASALTWTVTVLALLIGYVAAVRIAGAPFNDLLSAEVEKIRSGGGEVLYLPPFLPGMLHALNTEVLRLAILLTLFIPLYLMSLLLPGVGAAIVTGLLVVQAALWLAYDAMSYCFDRRLWPLRKRLGFLRRHWWHVLQFGLGGAAILAIPLVNLFLFPLLVSGGTLLFRDLDQQEVP
jgi:uncharacterized protein involved in cysteine biosynthesis